MSLYRYATITAFSAILLSSCFQLSAQNWANWRGPTQNGISPEVDLVDHFAFEKDGSSENVLWKSDIGGRATPIILNGRVYLNCRTHHNVNDPDDKINAGEQVVCWDAASGELLWRDVFNVFQTDIPAPRVGWAAMCGDPETGNVYVHSVSGIFRCYKPNGEVVWEYSMHEEFGKLSGYGGRTQTPIIDEDRVIVSFLGANWGDTKGPGPKHYYYAFDKRTGEVEWISAPGGVPKDTNYSAPVVAVIEGQRLLIGGNGDGHLYAMQARTGKKVWEFKLSLRGLNCTPVVNGKYVYISHGEDNIDNTEFGRVQCIDGSGSGDITETGSVWRIDGIKAGYTACLFKDDVLYVTSDTGKIYAFDGGNGEQLWNYAIGTVGKGSPVWADGKIYATEVNGRLHILEADREGCKSLCEVELEAADGNGVDEIYASPAIAGGRVYFVTRDRTFCVGAKDAVSADFPVEDGPEENATEAEIATLLMVPGEVRLRAGQSAEFKVKAFDSNGNFIREIGADEMPTDGIKLGEGLAGKVTVEGNKITVPNGFEEFVAGNFTVNVGDVEAKGRLRAISGANEWSWDFEGYKPLQVPPTWVRAHVKIKPTLVPGTENMAMKSSDLEGVRGRPSHIVWMGTPDMTNYTVQSDVYLTEQRRSMSKIGIINNRYSLVLKGNDQKLEIQSWAAHLRLGASQDFTIDPDVWYRMKLVVKVNDDSSSTIYGKVWDRTLDEPEEWTIEATDPRANEQGSPGLYMYSLADSYFDNIIIKSQDDETEESSQDK